MSSVGGSGMVFAGSVVSFPRTILLSRINQGSYLGAAVMLTLVRETTPISTFSSLATGAL